jgi:hypothetical protein
MIDYDPWWRRVVGGFLLTVGGVAAWVADVLLRKGARVRSRAI